MVEAYILFRSNSDPSLTQAPKCAAQLHIKLVVFKLRASLDNLRVLWLFDQLVSDRSKLMMMCWHSSGPDPDSMGKSSAYVNHQGAVRPFLSFLNACDPVNNAMRP
jgi:hypothetical protein